MTETTEINHGQNIATLAIDYELDKNYENYREALTKGEGSLERTIRPITQVLTRGDRNLENLLLNAQPQAIEHEVSNYHEAHKNEIKKAFEESQDFITQHYVSGLNQLIQGIIEEVSGQEGFDELSDEEKEAHIRPLVYLSLVEALKELQANDNEIKKVQKEFFGLDKASDAEAYKKVNDYLTRDLKLSSNAMNLAEVGRVYRGSVVPRAKSMLSRFVASKLINEGIYEINADKFKQIYGNKENYRKLAYNLLQEQMAEAQRAQAA